MVLALACSLAAAMFSGQPSSLESRIATMLPTAEETQWQQIPWRFDLMSARQAASKERKPMFLWVMNGHPFGCT